MITTVADEFFHAAEQVRLNRTGSAAWHASVTYFDLIREAMPPELVAVANEVAGLDLEPDELANLLRARACGHSSPLSTR